MEYVRANFCTLDELCADTGYSPSEIREAIDCELLPKASCALPDGTEMYPPDYLLFVDEAGGPEQVYAYFVERYRAAREFQAGQTDALDEVWRGYLDGAYGLCLRSVTPEAIVRRDTLVSRICELLILSRPGDADWRDSLRTAVEELDALGREFSPLWDRVRFGRLTTRDLVVYAAIEHFPEVFNPCKEAG
jgi:hypothetical protein